MKRQHIPLALIAFRAALIPLMPLAIVLYSNAAVPFVVAAMTLGIISDIFDGIIARRLHCDTDRLRRLDSQTDAVFWCAVLLSTAFCRPAWFIAQQYVIGTLLVFEALCYCVSFLRFKRETCTHSWLSKAWGISLCAAFSLLLLGYPFAYRAWDICVFLGILSQMEVLLILCLLPRWQRDIPTVLHAWRIRRHSAN
jgi:phosphatidylglycerophosphate synthase